MMIMWLLREIVGRCSFVLFSKSRLRLIELMSIVMYLSKLVIVSLSHLISSHLKSAEGFVVCSIMMMPTTMSLIFPIKWRWTMMIAEDVADKQGIEQIDWTHNAGEAPRVELWAHYRDICLHYIWCWCWCQLLKRGRSQNHKFNNRMTEKGERPSGQQHSLIPFLSYENV